MECAASQSTVNGKSQPVVDIQSKVANFLKILKINDLSNITITSLKTTNVVFVNSNSECVQFDVNFNILLDFNVDLKISYPRKAVFNEYTEIEKLRINVNNEVWKQEIISCTNYLQRQKNVNLALSILKRCAIAMSERKLILDMLVLHSEGFITHTNHEDGGVMIVCVNPNTSFKFFESVWKIQFDCVHNLVMDCIDFSVTLLDADFNNAAKPLMKNVVKPELAYNDKVNLWWKIMFAVSNSVTQELLEQRPNRNQPLPSNGRPSYVTVRSATTENRQNPEIPVSDEEDCIIIEDD